MGKKLILRRKKGKKGKESKKSYNKSDTGYLNRDDPTSVPQKTVYSDIHDKDIKKSKSVISKGKEKIVRKQPEQKHDLTDEDKVKQQLYATKQDKKRIVIKGRPIKGIDSIHKLNLLSNDDGSLLQQIDITKKPKYESWSDDVNTVALLIAEEWDYDEILEGAEDPKRAPRICGWLQDRYRNFQWLIDNFVLEVAAWYAQNRRKDKVKIVSVISGIPLELYKWSKVDLTRIHRLENYPKQPFINIIFIGEDYLDEAVYWLENSEWIIDNEMVRVNLGRFCGDLIAWLDWNVPVILITYLPFRNKGLYRASAEAKKIVKMQDDMKLKLVHVYKQKVDSLDVQIDDLKREAKEWKKLYFDTNKDISLLLRREQERRRYAEEAREETKKFNGFSVFLVCVAIALGILSVVGFIT